MAVEEEEELLRSFKKKTSPTSYSIYPTVDNRQLSISKILFTLELTSEKNLY